MKRLKGLSDSDSKKMIVEYKTDLLENNFNILEDCVKKRILKNELPEEFEIKLVEDNKCILSFYIDIPNSSTFGSLPPKVANQISDCLFEFRNKSIKKMFKEIEFIPLSGYPLSNLQKDIIEAIKNKRDFCILDKYENYVKFSKNELFKLNQYQAKFGSSDYSDVAIYIHTGNMKRLVEQFRDKLEIFDWE